MPGVGWLIINIDGALLEIQKQVFCKFSPEHNHFAGKDIQLIPTKVFV
jgi:hypothetical protein